MSPPNRPQPRVLLDDKLLDMHSNNGLILFSKHSWRIFLLFPRWRTYSLEYDSHTAFGGPFKLVDGRHHIASTLSCRNVGFAHGGVRAVTALATAATDNEQVMNLLQRLPEIYLQPLVGLIDRIEPHPDFVYMVETLERKKPARLSKRRHIPEPRSRRRSRNPSELGILKPAVKDAEFAVHGSSLDSKTAKRDPKHKARPDPS